MLQRLFIQKIWIISNFLCFDNQSVFYLRAYACIQHIFDGTHERKINGIFKKRQTKSIFYSFNIYLCFCFHPFLKSLNDSVFKSFKSLNLLNLLILWIKHIVNGYINHERNMKNNCRYFQKYSYNLKIESNFSV